MAETLAVKYRPKTFDEFVGQSVTMKILRKIIKEKKYKNIFLFSGDTGCGKTSAARLVASEINGGIGSPIEIDAASNNGVDDVRALIASADERALVGEYKIFIIDECHSLTTQAWQAFLKKIEECPKYTIFIFCTTEPQKLPATILNRMQKYTFAPISADLIQDRLEYICQQEGFTNYKEVCNFISKVANGSMRNAISYLEQCADYSTELSLDIAKKLTSCFSYESVFKLTWALLDNNLQDILSTIDTIFANGQDLKAFIDWYIGFILDLIKYNVFKQISLTTIPEYLSTNENPVVQYTIEKLKSVDDLNYTLDTLLELKNSIKYDMSYKNTIIITLLQIARHLAKGAN